MALAKGRTERGNLEAKGCYVPPSGKRPRKWPSQGPPATVGERYLTAGLGWPLGRTWPNVFGQGGGGVGCLGTALALVGDGLGRVVGAFVSLCATPPERARDVTIA